MNECGSERKEVCMFSSFCRLGNSRKKSYVIIWYRTQGEDGIWGWSKINLIASLWSSWDLEKEKLLQVTRQVADCQSQ